MKTTLQDLILMVRLQKIYSEIAGLFDERRTEPPEVEELHQQNLQRKQELAGLESQISELREEISGVRRKEEESALELEHFQKQKSMVQNEREFTAVISEIDFATRSLEEAKTRREELENNIADLEANIETRQKEIPEEEAAHREITENWDKRKAEIKERIQDLALQARAIEEELTPKNRAHFLRLLKSKHGVAIAPVVEGACSMCHFKLRPHLQQRVRRCEETITCEHCLRILYLEESLKD